MDLSIFATQTVSSKAPLSGNGTLLGGNSLVGDNGLGVTNGAAFLEAILSNLISADGDEIKSDVSNQNTENEAPATNVKKEAVDLSLLQLALLGQDAEKSLDEKISELKIEELLKTEGNRVDQLTKLINHLTSGLPQEFGAEESIEDLVSRLNNRLENLESSLEAFRNNDFTNENAPFKLLIATGLNPAQLTNITSRIEEVESKLGRELTVEDLIAGVGNIIPVIGDTDTNIDGDYDYGLSQEEGLYLLLKRSNEYAADIKEQKKLEEIDLQNSPFTNAQILEDTPLQDTQVSIGLVPATPKNDVTAQSKKLSNPTKHYDVQDLLNIIAANKVTPVVTTPSTALQPTVNDTTILPEDGVTPVPQTLSNSEFRELFGSNNNGNNNGNIGLKNTVANLQATNITPDTAVPKVAFLGDLFLPTSFLSGSASQPILGDILGLDIQTGTPFTQTTQAAHLTTSTQHASQTHPGTSTVTAQISRAAQTGDTRSITLQLDPADLGRLEVRLEFGPEQTVKAYLVVEKQETLQMLQRDMAALERALQDAGLETGADSLNYEMAEDNYGFGDDKNGQNGNSGTENAENNLDENDIEIIETTMNWNVDPETGHVHYNILA